MVTHSTKQDPEALAPADRDDVIATFGPSDCLTFVEAVKNDFPDTFDQVIAHLTRTLWAGDES